MPACPHCAAPLSSAPPARYCGRCFLAIQWSGGAPSAWLPDVKPGECLLSLDMRHQRLPGMPMGEFTLGDQARFSQHPAGLGLEVRARKTVELEIPFLRRRDQCVRATFIAYDPSIIVHVAVRRESVGDATTQYALMASPGRQIARIVRITSSPERTVATPLVDWARPPRMGHLGEPVDCELRAQGATIEARVGGDLFARVHEPRLGVGCPGVCIEAEGGPGRAVWMGFEVREVTA